MYGDEFGYAYFEQRHREMMQAAERERLIQALEKAQRDEQRRASLGKRVLGATGNRLVAMGNRLQQAAAH